MKTIYLTYDSVHPHIPNERVDICVQTDGGITIDTAAERFVISRDPSSPYRYFSRFVAEGAFPAQQVDCINLNKLALAAEGRLV